MIIQKKIALVFFLIFIQKIKSIFRSSLNTNNRIFSCALRRHQLIGFRRCWTTAGLSLISATGCSDYHLQSTLQLQKFYRQQFFLPNDFPQIQEIPTNFTGELIKILLINGQQCVAHINQDARKSMITDVAVDETDNRSQWFVCSTRQCSGITRKMQNVRNRVRH